MIRYRVLLAKRDIDGRPIRSVIVFQFRRTYEYDWDDFTVMYGVPDSRIVPGFRNVQLLSVRVKSFPFIGRVKAVEWRENDIELHLRNHLSEDSFINATITATGKDFKVITHPNNECWKIQTDYSVIVVRNGAKLAPSKLVCDCCQAVANHLLKATSRSPS